MAKVEDKVTSAEKQKAIQKADNDRVAGAVGAEAVALAVKRVADAAVAEVQKDRTPYAHDFAVSTNGKHFRIRGAGFRASGTVFLNGAAARTTAWGNENIEGFFPDGAQPGEVVVQIDPETAQRGYAEFVAR